MYMNANLQNPVKNGSFYLGLSFTSDWGEGGGVEFGRIPLHTFHRGTTSEF